ncbi:MAG: hypothetical protein ACQEQY_07605 [Halobacteriota archaeon]
MTGRPRFSHDAEKLGANKMWAVLLNVDAIGSLLQEPEDALAHEVIPPRVAEEIAEPVEMRKWSLEYEPHVFRFEQR